MFVRGTNEFMENIIDFGAASSSYKRVIKSNKEAGLHSIVFARKTIDEAKVIVMVDRYKKIVQTSLDLESDLDALFNSIECNLRFAAVVGIRNTVKEDAMSTVDQFKAMGIKTHMLTGDTFENSISTAIFLNLLPNNSQKYIVLDFADSHDGQGKIQDVLEKLKTSLTKKRTANDELSSHTSSLLGSKSTVSIDNNRMLTHKEDLLIFSQYYVVSGRAIEVIMANKYLYTHFTFILQFAQSIVGFDMKPLHKGILIKLMKEANPNRNIMTIGDGLNDISMMHQSDISVQIIHEHTELIYGDLVAKDLSVIPMIMSNQGLRYNSNLNLAIFSCFYNSITVTCILFYYQFYCSFTSTAIIQTGLFYSTSAAHCALCVLYVILENRFGDTITNQIPAVYAENVYFNNNNLTHFFVLVISI